MSTASPDISDFQMFYTGGGANSTLSASIGGAISSVRVLNQSTSGISTVTGVVIDDALGNLAGAGTLTYTLSGTTLTWTPPSGSAGTPVNVSAGGRFFIQGSGVGAGGLCVTVTAASLPGANATDTITVANIVNTMFADVTKAQSLSGVNIYHCFAVKNAHASMSMTGILEWIASNTGGQDNISIGLDPLAAGTGAVGPTAVANENTAPAGVTFVNPTSNTDPNVLSLGTLTTGQVRFIWFRLTVPANVSVATPANIYARGFSITA